MSPDDSQLEDTPDPPAPQIPMEHYAAMGRVADTWTDLEFAIDHIIWELMHVEQAFGACVTSQFNSIHPRARALLALANLYNVNTSTIKSLSSILGQAQGLSEQRNRLIHDKRMVRHRNNEVIRFEVSAKKDLIFADVHEPISDLFKFMDSVESIIVKFDTVCAALRSELYASGYKTRAKLPRLTRFPRGPATTKQALSKSD
jgi:hypothetical protein